MMFIMKKTKCLICGSTNTKIIIGGYPGKGKRLICLERGKNLKLHEKMEDLKEEIDNTASPSLKKTLQKDLKVMVKEFHKK